MPTSENSEPGDNEVECVGRREITIKSVITALKRHVLPSLVAIYDSHHVNPGNPVQVGTGFLLTHKSRPVLVTARHVLEGHNRDKSPAEMAFHVDGKWAYVGDGNGSRYLYYGAEGRDLVAFYADELGQRPLLPAPAASVRADGVRVIAICGYLSRDFKRPGDQLKPQPLIHIDKFVGRKNGILSILYTKRRNVDSDTGERKVSPKPKGLSGGPMLNSVSLLKGTVEIVGVFTEQSDGVGRGECATHIANILTRM